MSFSRSRRPPRASGPRMETSGCLGTCVFFPSWLHQNTEMARFWLVVFFLVGGWGEVKMCGFVVCMKKSFDLIENHVTYVYPCSASWGFSLGILGVVFSPINTHNYFFRASIYRVFPSTTGPTLGYTILVHPSALFPPEALHFSRGLFAPSCSCAISLRSRSSWRGKGQPRRPFRSTVDRSYSLHPWDANRSFEWDGKWQQNFREEISTSVQYICRNQKSWKPHGNQRRRVKIGQNMGIPFIQNE